MDPEQLERLHAILQFEVYGIPLSFIGGACVFIMVVLFLFAGKQQRSLLGRLFDLLVVVVCIALLLGCLFGGLYIGGLYNATGWGGLAGVLVFWLVFFVIGSVKTSIKNDKERKALAHRLYGNRRPD